MSQNILMRQYVSSAEGGEEVLTKDERDSENWMAKATHLPGQLISHVVFQISYFKIKRTVNWD